MKTILGSWGIMGMLAGIAAAGVVAIGQSFPAGKDASATMVVTAGQFDAAVEAQVQERLPAAVAAEIQRRIAAGDAAVKLSRLQRSQIADEEIAARDLEARTSAAYNLVRTLQSQLALYAIQHRDHLPALAQLQNWDVFLQRTDASGAICEKGTFGPYVAEYPANPFTGRSRVVAAGAANMVAGWSYDERKGIIRLIVPRQWSAGLGSRFKAEEIETPTAAADRDLIWDTTAVNAARSTLQTVRSQLELYKIQHDDRPPTLDELRNWRVLLVATDERGREDAKARLGPYLQVAPKNPFNGKTQVSAHGQADGDTGWTYDAKRWVLRVVTPNASQREEMCDADAELPAR